MLPQEIFENLGRWEHFWWNLSSVEVQILEGSGACSPRKIFENLGRWEHFWWNLSSVEVQILEGSGGMLPQEIFENLGRWEHFWWNLSSVEVQILEGSGTCSPRKFLKISEGESTSDGFWAMYRYRKFLNMREHENTSAWWNLIRGDPGRQEGLCKNEALMPWVPKDGGLWRAYSPGEFFSKLYFCLCHFPYFEKHCRC